MADTYRAVRQFGRLLKGWGGDSVRNSGEDYSGVQRDGNSREGENLIAVVRYHPSDKRVEIVRPGDLEQIE